MYFRTSYATLVTEAAPDYSAGDLCGGLVAWPMRQMQGSGRLTRLSLKSIDTFAGVASKLYFFRDNPTASTFTENAAISINSADRDFLIDVTDIAAADFTDYTARAGLYIARKTLDLRYTHAAGVKTIYTALVPENTLNLSSVSSLSMILEGEVD